MPSLNNVGPMDLEAGDLVRDKEDTTDYIIDSVIFGALGAAVVFGLSAYSDKTRTWVTNSLDEIGVDRIKRANGRSTQSQKTATAKLAEGALDTVNASPRAGKKGIEYYETLDSIVRDMFLIGEDLSQTPGSTAKKTLDEVAKAVAGHTNVKFSSRSIFNALKKELGGEYEEDYLKDIADRLSGRINSAFGSKDSRRFGYANDQLIEDILFPESGQGYKNTVYNRLLTNQNITEEAVPGVKKTTHALLEFLNSPRASELGPNLSRHPLLRGSSMFSIAEEGSSVAEETLANIYANYHYTTGGKKSSSATSIFRSVAKRDLEILQAARISNDPKKSLKGLSSLGAQLLQDKLMTGETEGLLAHIDAYHGNKSYNAKFATARKSTFNRGEVKRYTGAAPGEDILAHKANGDDVFSMRKGVFYNKYLKNKKVQIGGSVYDLRIESEAQEVAKYLNEMIPGSSTVMFRPDELLAISQSEKIDINDIINPQSTIANDLRIFGTSVEEIVGFHLADKGMGINHLDSRSAGVVSFQMPRSTSVRNTVKMLGRGHITSQVLTELNQALGLGEDVLGAQNKTAVFRATRMVDGTLVHERFLSLEELHRQNYTDLIEIGYGSVFKGTEVDFLETRIEDQYLQPVRRAEEFSGGWNLLARGNSAGNLNQVLTEGLSEQQVLNVANRESPRSMIERTIGVFGNIDERYGDAALARGEQNTRFAFLLVGGNDPIIIQNKSGSSIEVQLRRADQLMAGSSTAAILDIETSSQSAVKGARTGIVDTATFIDAQGLSYLRNKYGDDVYRSVYEEHRGKSTLNRAIEKRSDEIIQELQDQNYTAVRLKIGPNASAKTRAIRLIKFVDQLDQMEVIGSQNFADFNFIRSDLERLLENPGNIDSDLLEQVKVATVKISNMSRDKGLATEIIPMVSGATRKRGFAQEGLTRTVLKRGEFHVDTADVVDLSVIIGTERENYTRNRAGTIVSNSNLHASLKHIRMIDNKFTSQFGSNITIHQIYQVMTDDGATVMEMDYSTASGIRRTEAISPDQLTNLFERNIVSDVSTLSPQSLGPNIESISDKVSRYIRELNPYANNVTALQSTWGVGTGSESKAASVLRARYFGDLILTDDIVAGFRGLTEAEVNDKIDALLGHDQELFKRRVLSLLEDNNSYLGDALQRDPDYLAHTTFWDGMYEQTKQVIKVMAVNDVERASVKELLSISSIQDLVNLTLDPQGKNMGFDALMLQLFGSDAATIGVGSEIRQRGGINYSIGFDTTYKYSVSQTMSGKSLNFINQLTEFMGQGIQSLDQQLIKTEGEDASSELLSLVGALNEEEKKVLIEAHRKAIQNAGFDPDNLDAKDFFRQNGFTYAESMRNDLIDGVSGDYLYGKALKQYEGLGQVMTKSIQSKIELLSDGAEKAELMMLRDNILEQIQAMQRDGQVQNTEVRSMVASILQEQMSEFLQLHSNDTDVIESKLELLRGLYEDHFTPRITNPEGIDKAKEILAQLSDSEGDLVKKAMEAAREEQNLESAYNKFNEIISSGQGIDMARSAAEHADKRRTDALREGARDLTGGIPPISQTEQVHTTVGQAVAGAHGPAEDAMKSQHAKVMKMANNFVGNGATAGFSIAILGAMMALKDYDPSYSAGNLSEKQGAGYYGINEVSNMPGSNSGIGPVLTPDSRGLFSLDIDINMHSDNAAAKEKIVEQVYNILNQTQEYRSVEHTKKDNRDPQPSPQDFLNRYL